MISISGHVASGLGKGEKFLAMDYYKARIREEIGFKPFEGTLNVLINKKAMTVLDNISKKYIPGFSKDGTAFGGLYWAAASLNKIDGAIIIPEKTGHKNIAEFIAPLNLRKQFNLKDNDKVNIQIKQEFQPTQTVGHQQPNK
ncbi:CTP-dependent riboflavin kinase [Candidatus Woesearchaeota archaeon]|nr:CTP-dependent riboflavin kinase [Candidatus Woesearchaeota archaeon]